MLSAGISGSAVSPDVAALRCAVTKAQRGFFRKPYLPPPRASRIHFTLRNSALCTPARRRRCPRCLPSQPNSDSRQHAVRQVARLHPLRIGAQWCAVVPNGGSSEPHPVLVWRHLAATPTCMAVWGAAHPPLPLPPAAGSVRRLTAPGYTPLNSFSDRKPSPLSRFHSAAEPPLSFTIQASSSACSTPSHTTPADAAATESRLVPPLADSPAHAFLPPAAPAALPPVRTSLRPSPLGPESGAPASAPDSLASSTTDTCLELAPSCTLDLELSPEEVRWAPHGPAPGLPAPVPASVPCLPCLPA